MTTVKLDRFGGMLPGIDDDLLPKAQASVSQNAYLYSGALRGWRKPKLLHTLLNSAAGFAYRIPLITEATAQAVLVFKSNPSDGDTVKLGEETYTFKNTLTTGYQVKIGATATDTATSLFKAFKVTGTAGVDYTADVCVNTDISTDNSTQGTHDFGSGVVPILTMVAPDPGAVFNLTVVTESTSAARLTWVATTASLTPAVTTFSGGVNVTADLNITGSSKWLEFVDQDTTVVRSPVVDDSFRRYYFASPTRPPEYNTYERIIDDEDPWLLGVPQPGCSPGVEATAGGSAAIFGDNRDSGSTAAVVANSLVLRKFTPDGDQSLQNVNLIVQTSSTTAKFTAVVYSDSSGSPSTLAAEGEEVVGAAAGDTITSVLPVPLGLSDQVPVWIGFIINEAVDLGISYEATAGYRAANTYPTVPDPAPAMTSGQASWMLWGDTINDAVLEARAYAYTWVTEYGEEGPPSSPTVVTSWSNATWTVSLFSPVPDDMGVVRNITKARIYRTVSSVDATTYFLVAEIDVSTDTYEDTIPNDEVVNNTILPSTNWFPPPENLQGLAAMPNGITVGWRSNEVWFSEAYRPHAWPPQNVLTTEFPVVGVGVAGQSAIICTQGHPEVATGVNSASMSLTKSKLPEPCLTARSIVSTDGGVFYAGRNGLIFITGAGLAQNVTEQWITRERWSELVPSKHLAAIKLASAYFCFGTSVGGDTSVAHTGFTIELTPEGAAERRVAFGTLTAPDDEDIVTVLSDPWTGAGLLIQDGEVRYYDFAETTPTSMAFVWRSRRFQSPAKENFAAFRVWFTVPAGTPAQSATRDESVVQTLTAGKYLIVRVYADDGTLVTTREVRSSGELLRITSGFKADYWQFEFEGIVAVQDFQAATSVSELRRV